MFERLVGNHPAKAVLSRLVAAGRVPNALLLAGPDSVGKRQFAFEIAAALVCKASDGTGPCGECSSCVRASAFTYPKDDDRDGHLRVNFSEHPDIGIVLPHNRNILVEAIRDLEREANFLPFEAWARVFIIDDADKLNDAASNALLKTLEEPPPTSYLFLVSSRPDSLLLTIRSRCQTVRFSAVESSEIELYLTDFMGMPKEDANLVAGSSNGGIGRALGLDTEKIRKLRDDMLTILTGTLLECDFAKVLQSSDVMTDAKNKPDFEPSLQMLGSLIHDIWLLKNGAEIAGLVHQDMAGRLADFSSSVTSVKLASWLSEIEELRENLLVNINRKVALDSMFVKIAGR
ncbi:MAG: DNA polymerase III subunit delta' [Pyrinomonadaceae bacterium]